MQLGPGARRFVLTAHIASSVGWLGAVVCFLVLSVVAITSEAPTTVRAIYVAMEPMGWWVLVPLSLLSLGTGLVQSLGTRWGLLRHYWVVSKLVINVAASAVLLLYMQTLDHLAGLASADADLDALRSPSPVLHSAAALVLLVVATVLSVYKPKGLTRRGWRAQQAVAAG